ncbi:hypothetical protein JW872_00580 [Candidatus Babeliales bacterium]|nr:hypothetical protein [Candidatus Babeliales bacterium]
MRFHFIFYVFFSVVGLIFCDEQSEQEQRKEDEANEQDKPFEFNKEEWWQRFQEEWKRIPDRYEVVIDEETVRRLCKRDTMHDRWRSYGCDELHHDNASYREPDRWPLRSFVPRNAGVEWASPGDALIALYTIDEICNLSFPRVLEGEFDVTFEIDGHRLGIIDLVYAIIMVFDGAAKNQEYDARDIVQEAFDESDMQRSANRYRVILDYLLERGYKLSPLHGLSYGEVFEAMFVMDAIRSYNGSVFISLCTLAQRGIHKKHTIVVRYGGAEITPLGFAQFKMYEAADLILGFVRHVLKAWICRSWVDPFVSGQLIRKHRQASDVVRILSGEHPYWTL